MVDIPWILWDSINHVFIMGFITIWVISASTTNNQPTSGSKESQHFLNWKCDVQPINVLFHVLFLKAMDDCVNIPVPWIRHGYEDLGRIAKKSLDRVGVLRHKQMFVSSRPILSMQLNLPGKMERENKTRRPGRGVGGGWLVGWFATLPAGFLLVCLFSLGGGMGDVINVINVFQVQSPGGFWHLEFLVSTDDAPLDFANFP